MMPVRLNLFPKVQVGHESRYARPPTISGESPSGDGSRATSTSAYIRSRSCPTAVPKSAVARLDTVDTRLNAMVDAIKSVRPDLKNFYASLSDDQKARFNTMGPPPKAASSGGQQ